MQIFKLVKLTASFENMLFVLSFDPRYVRKFLEDNADDDISFLDKIIQTPISLPAIDQAKIDRFLLYSEADGSHRSSFDVLFDKLLIGKHRIKEFDDSFVHLYGSQIRHFFYSFRRAKRYLNALYTTLPSVKNEVHLQDFLY